METISLEKYEGKILTHNTGKYNTILHYADDKNKLFYVLDDNGIEQSYSYDLLDEYFTFNK